VQVRYPLAALLAIAALVIAGVALAAEPNLYADGDVLGPGGYRQTSGWNNRDWNDACRQGNSGYMSAAYYDANMSRFAYTGRIYTNCGLGATATINDDAYAKARCTHEGTVSFAVFCQTTNGLYPGEP